jgi:hydrogenase expression/formation protein HypE
VKNNSDKTGTVMLAYGGGGTSARAFVEREIVARLGSTAVESLDDSAIFQTPGTKLAFTTDAFVVKPLFFPGGNIGKLSICGTVNDLAVCGATPRYISLTLVIEQGFDLAELRRIIDSIATEASRANVEVVCGDTKVVAAGEADGIFITTSGIGSIDNDAILGMDKIQPGDRIIISGTAGDHGAAILAARENLGISTPIPSDCANVAPICKRLCTLDRGLRFMRDPTRGGVAAITNEIASATGYTLTLNEAAIPMTDQVRTICEMTGIDPLYLACEGKVIVITTAAAANEALQLMQQSEYGESAAIIGEVTDRRNGLVNLKTVIGSSRLLILPENDPLPRIC